MIAEMLDVDTDLSDVDYHAELDARGLQECKPVIGEGHCVKLPCGVVLRCFGCNNRERLDYILAEAAQHRPPHESPLSCWGCYEDTLDAIATAMAYRASRLDQSLSHPTAA